jgi:hypothetical protein
MIRAGSVDCNDDGMNGDVVTGRIYSLFLAEAACFVTAADIPPLSLA